MGNTVTVTVEDENTDPVELADVVVVLRSSRMLQASGRTGANGQVVFANMADGDYTLKVSKRGMRGPDVEFSVAGVAAAVDAPLTTLAITDPTPPTTCRVYGFVQLPPGTAPHPVEVFVSEIPKGDGTRLLGSGSSGMDPRNLIQVPIERTVLVEDGRWEVELVRGARVTVRSWSIGLDKTFTVPNASEACISDLLSYPSAANKGLGGETSSGRGFRS